MITDPFLSAVAALLREALREAGVEPAANLPAAIEQPPDPEMGDYAFPCFPLARQLRKGPPLIAKDLAARIVPRLGAQAAITGVEAAGPYVNFRVSLPEMARQDLAAVLNGSFFGRNRAGGGVKTMIEYSQPNTHKAFHVGHMRNVALGDALVRIVEFNGNPVVAANYIGDVGAHIAKCLWYYQRHRSEAPPASGRGEWLGTQYTAATLMLESAPEAERKRYEAEIGAVLQALEAQTGPVHELWLETRQWSLDAFDEIYRWLGARFDHVFYESEMGEGRRIVEEGLARGVFQRSQGAVGADLEAFGLGFFLVLKADGTTLYATKDLALAKIKFERFGIASSIYVVGAEQALHFRQVFKTLELLGYPQAAQCHHLSYGLVMLPEGKMSSRAGTIVAFSRLRAEMDAFIRSHYLDAHQGEWPEEEIAGTARRIAVAAIRYGMVKQDPGRAIVFNLEDWLASEGDTGTYLCYAFTRIQSVLRNAGGLPVDPRADFALLTQDTERRVIRQIHEFNRVVRQAGEQLRPNLLANYLFHLCKEFSRTYVTSPVLRAESPQLARARLALFAATGAVLERGLALLGIVPPSRM